MDMVKFLVWSIQAVGVRVVLFLTYWLIDGFEPIERPIGLREEELQRINYPATEELVTVFDLFIVVLVIYSSYFLALRLCGRFRLREVRACALALTIALPSNGIVTSLAKAMFGRLRPDFLARCNGGVSSDGSHCQGDIGDIREGRRSFPSGHSSFAFCTLLYLSLLIGDKLGVFRGGDGQWRLWTMLLPIGVAFSVALTRTMDFHHHWEDVLCGSFIGIGMGIWCYVLHQHYV